MHAYTIQRNIYTHTNTWIKIQCADTVIQTHTHIYNIYIRNHKSTMIPQFQSLRDFCVFAIYYFTFVLYFNHSENPIFL